MYVAHLFILVVVISLILIARAPTTSTIGIPIRPSSALERGVVESING